jgi:hypothetical protein
MWKFPVNGFRVCLVLQSREERITWGTRTCPVLPEDTACTNFAY